MDEYFECDNDKIYPNYLVDVSDKSDVKIEEDSRII